jgi:hypothetical protein
VVRPGNDPKVPSDDRTTRCGRWGTGQGGRDLTDDRTPEPEVLRGASDQLLIAIGEVDALERRKRGLRPSDPDFPALALDVRRAAERVLDLARAEEIAARYTQEQPDAASLPPIAQMSPAKELAGILDEWRAVEHKLLAADAGSTEAADLQARFEQLRERYGRTLKARQQGG